MISNFKNTRFTEVEKLSRRFFHNPLISKFMHSLGIFKTKKLNYPIEGIP